MNASWEGKVHRVIATFARAAYLQANISPSGKMYSKHRPYTLPVEASDLIELLGCHDRVHAENECKALLMLYRVQGKKIDA